MRDATGNVVRAKRPARRSGEVSRVLIAAPGPCEQHRGRVSVWSTGRRLFTNVSSSWQLAQRMEQPGAHERIAEVGHLYEHEGPAAQRPGTSVSGGTRRMRAMEVTSSGTVVGVQLPGRPAIAFGRRPYAAADSVRSTACPFAVSTTSMLPRVAFE